jgi:hypothetical protein
VEQPPDEMKFWGWCFSNQQFLHFTFEYVAKTIIDKKPKPFVTEGVYHNFSLGTGTVCLLSSFSKEIQSRWCS